MNLGEFSGLGAAEAALIEKYLIIEDGQERLQCLTGRKLRVSALREGERVEGCLVRGCSSKIWLAGGVEEGVLRLRMESESALVRALAAVPVELCEGRLAGEVLGWNPSWVEGLGLERFLSGTRRHGLEQIQGRIRLLAGGE